MPSGLRSDPSEWTDDRHKRGLAAEQQAIRYLRSLGWQLLEHRYRVGRNEIDLIVRRGKVVAFVEVKARWGDGFGSPLEAVTGAKRRELVKAARVWVDRQGRVGDIYRFDCIGFTGGRIDYVPDAFRPGWR